MREYRVKITVKNNLLLSAIENAGFKTQAEFARSANLSVQKVNDLIAMRDCPITSHGIFTDQANAIMEALGACPTDLWTVEQLNLKLEKNTADCAFTALELQSVLGMNPVDLLEMDRPDEHLSEKQKQEAIEKVLETLTDQEQEILKLRYGFQLNDEHTFHEIGKKLKVSGQRIRQVESKALRKLRHPKRLIKIKEFYEEQE